MPVVINQMQAQVSEQSSDRSAPPSPVVPKPLERDAVHRLLRLTAERRSRLAAD
jgi:hypothetical protein